MRRRKDGRLKREKTEKQRKIKKETPIGELKTPADGRDKFSYLLLSSTTCPNSRVCRLTCPSAIGRIRLVFHIRISVVSY